MGKDTRGALALVEVVGLPGSGPPPHIHRRVDEVYCLLEGELEVLNDARTFTADAGSVFYIPKGTLHAWRNALRVETQLGFKMVKWICAIEVMEDYGHIGKGQGGWREDNQYYGTGAGI